MNTFKLITTGFIISSSLVSSSEFTVSSYNAGGLSDHYDYLRVAAMQKVMQERYTAEPETMALNEKIQQVALKLLFAPESEDKQAIKREWLENDYQHHFENFASLPSESNSPNSIWSQRIEQIITSYQIRPVIIHDEEVNEILNNHLNDLTCSKGVNDLINNKGDLSELLKETRSIMAKRIFTHHLKFDIICLQEANYLDSSIFPEHFEVLLSTSSRFVNGVVWNKKRFEHLETLGSILDRGFAVKLLDKESGKTVLIASGHLTGCNPYKQENNDSKKGDTELNAIISLFEETNADFKVIGMDSNVTSLHPRLNILKDAGYQIDYENYLDPTCANPHQALNTRIDWIAVKNGISPIKTITNIPVLNVGLNSLETNISDHKPIASKISY